MEGLLTKSPAEEGALHNPETDAVDDADLSSVVAPDTIPEDLVESAGDDADEGGEPNVQTPASSDVPDITPDAADGNDSLMKVVRSTASTSRCSSEPA